MVLTMERQINPARESLAPRNTEPALAGARSSMIETRPANRSVTDYDSKTENTVVIPSWGSSAGSLKFNDVFPKPPSELTITSGVIQSGQTQPIYGDSDPFRIAADVFSRFYSGTPTETPQSPVVVGDTSTSGGRSGNGGLFVLLAVVGVVGYFLYKRYAQ